jgi:hypothetical protein
MYYFKHYIKTKLFCFIGVIMVFQNFAVYAMFDGGQNLMRTPAELSITLSVGSGSWGEGETYVTRRG